MSWPINPRLASCLIVLRDEINAVWPGRSKTSDGTIGDPAHFSRGSASDHNPWVVGADGVGVVRAIDITNDPSGGPNNDQLAETLRRIGASGDPRLRGGYVIWDRRIADARHLWQWRTYSGVNPHDKHLHLSVTTDPAGFDRPGAWGLRPVIPVPPSPPVPIPPHLEDILRDLVIYRDDAHHACVTDGRHSHGISEPLRVALAHGGVTGAPDNDADYATILALPEWPATS